MNSISDAVLFSVILAVNLLLVGSLAVGSLVVSFRLLKNVAPRVRYVISLAAFMVTVIVPVTMSAADSPARIAIAGARQEGLIAAVSGPTEGPITALSDTLDTLTASFSNSGAGHIFFFLWVAGVLYLGFLEGAAHWQLRARVKTWKPAADSERDELLCPKGLPLYFDEDERPGTVGLFNPAVVLPTGITNGLPLDSVRLIVRHEAAHARWRDPLVNSLLRLIRSVFWVCPALWLIEHYARAETEAAADHAAVMEFSANGTEFEATAVKYATTLVAAAKQFNSFGPRENYRPQTASIGVGSGLEARVRRLLEYSAEPSRGRVASAVVIAALSLAAMMAMPSASLPHEAVVALPGIDTKTHSPGVTEKAEQFLSDDVETTVSELTGGPGRNLPSAAERRSKTEGSRPPALEVERRTAAAALSRVMPSGSDTAAEGGIEGPHSSREASAENVRELRALDTRLRTLDGLEAGLSQLSRAQTRKGR